MKESPVELSMNGIFDDVLPYDAILNIPPIFNKQEYSTGDSDDQL